MAPNFAPGSCDPRAAYALGMVVKMLRTSSSSCASSSSEKSSASQATASSASLADNDGKRDASAAVPLWQVKLDKLQRVLESPHVKMQAKQGLVALIEDAESVQDVWTFLDRVDNSSDCVESVQPNASDAATAAVTHSNDSLVASHEHEAVLVAAIPEELGCAICCSELMLRPVSLACGHSFCKYCLELWLANRANCPSCRHAAPSESECALSVNVALQQVIATFFPLQLAALQSQSQAERFAALRRAIHDALSSSNSDDLRDVLARLPAGTGSSSSSAAAPHASRRQQDQSLAVALILESDVELQERVLAAEIHERLRKERLLRESSRRRHTAAYNTTGLSAHVNPALLHMSNSTTTVRRNSNGNNSNSNKSNNLLATFLSRKS